MKTFTHFEELRMRKGAKVRVKTFGRYVFTDRGSEGTVLGQYKDRHRVQFYKMIGAPIGTGLRTFDIVTTDLEVIE